MDREVVIAIAEDDTGHVSLIKKNLRRSSISNKFVHFRDGKETLDFFFRTGDGPYRTENTPYLLLLDIRMPKVDGIEVLKKLKTDDELRKMPVIMITTTDDPLEVERCHGLGCSSYIVKPVEYDEFIDCIRQLGMFLKVIQIPEIDGFEKEH